MLNFPFASGGNAPLLWKYTIHVSRLKARKTSVRRHHRHSNFGFDLQHFRRLMGSRHVAGERQGERRRLKRSAPRRKGTLRFICLYACHVGLSTEAVSVRGTGFIWWLVADIRSLRNRAKLSPPFPFDLTLFTASIRAVYGNCPYTLPTHASGFTRGGHGSLQHNSRNHFDQIDGSCCVSSTKS